MPSNSSAHRALFSIRNGLSSAHLSWRPRNLSSPLASSYNLLARTTPHRLATTTAKSTTTKPAPSRPASKAFTKTSSSNPSSPAPATYASTASNSKTEPPPSTNRNAAAQTPSPVSLTEGLSDLPPSPNTEDKHIDWTRTYHGLGQTPFSAEARDILLAPIDPEDIEVKPDGILYLPEIKYRRILNKAFGPGSWGLVPRGETIVTERLVTREYALVIEGRLVSIARGEQQYFDSDGIPTATEGCKSNALMRCCKDIGIASELWDPRFIRKFIANNVREAWVEHVVNKKKRKISLRKDDVVRYPYKETKA